MGNWPAAPLIMITEGTSRGYSVAGSAAVPVDIYDNARGYYLLTGPRRGAAVTPGCDGDSILAWKTAVPVALNGLYN